MADAEFGVIPLLAELGKDDAAFAKAASEGFPPICRLQEGADVASKPPGFSCDFTGSDGVEYGLFDGMVAEKDAALSASTPGPLGLKRGAPFREAEKKLQRAGSKPNHHLEDDGTVSLLSSLCDANGIMDLVGFEVSFDREGGAQAVRLRVTVV